MSQLNFSFDSLALSDLKQRAADRSGRETNMIDIQILF